MDGYPAEFFKEYWPIIGKEVIKGVQQFFQTGRLLKEINCTTVTLILKVKNPSYVKEFRLIVCCSIMYKIIAKILTNKLKLVVDLLVGPSQSAFIEGRNILDNVIMVHELIKGFTRKLGKELIIYSRCAYGIQRQNVSRTSAISRQHPIQILGSPFVLKENYYPQCMPLVEKTVERIRSWISKFLSYAGRLQLIKSVLNYLWPGSHENTHRAPISWETLCKPKVVGGLNIINYERWNKAALTKLLWAIIAKKDKPWIRWIHCHYIKQNDINTMRSQSRLVRKLFTTREWWANDIPTIESFVQNGKFSIQKAYLHATPRYPKVHWKALVMLTGILPKQQFILWMTIQRRLATVDKLAKWGIRVTHSCVLCGGDIEETHDHLYFECPYSQSLWTEMLEWLSYQRKVENWEDEVQ
ncbi:uncharacterized protein LOC142166146 [Nicotiana tabacum]|uniref:Uncharacterized protein LOC142166146 n=1 Tax=Nicotiana tabacum TaxID=4097 RepID=A0AC58S6V4_TOBAC